VETEASPVENRGSATEERLAIIQGSSRDAVVQEFENGESEGLLLFLRFAPGALGGDQVGEERVQAGGRAGGGETVGFDGLTKFSLEPEGRCFYVASDSAGTGMLGTFESMTFFDVPSEGANEFDGLGAVG